MTPLATHKSAHSKKNIVFSFFLIAATIALFGAGGYVFYVFSHRTLVQKQMKEQTPFGVVLLNVRDLQSQDWETTLLTVAYIYPKTRRIGFISFYPFTRLNPGELSLEERIRSRHFEDIKSELGNILNIPIKYHIVSDIKAISQLVDLGEGIKYFNWDPEGNFPGLPQGEFTLDGAMIERLLLPKMATTGLSLPLYSHYTLFLNFWKEKTTKWPLLKPAEIFGQIKNSLQTDLSLSDLLFMGDTIFSNENWLTMFMEIPVKRDYDKYNMDLDATALFLKSFLKDLTNPKNPYLEQTARVEVRNGTYVSNLARKTGRALSRKGITVLEFSNADRNDYRSSILLDISANPYYLQSMARALGIKKYYAAVNRSVFTDVIMIIGADHEKYLENAYE